MSERDEGKGKAAARTTIVGGQPPGNERSLELVPSGLEQLLGMAAVDEAFRDALLADPSGTAEGVGLELVQAEQRVLASVSREQLAAMIGQVDRRLPDPDRRSFLSLAGAAMVALAGGASLAGVACKSIGRPDPLPAGVRPSLKAGQPATRPGPVPAGIRPRPKPIEPKKDAGPPDAGPSVAPTHKPLPNAGMAAPRPKPQVNRGIRPDRPLDR
jgi:hypothetical protein